MEKENKEKNNKGVITFLIVIIIILLVLVVLSATGTISFKSDTIDNSNSQTNENNNSTISSNDINNCDKNYSYMYNDKAIYKVKVINNSGAKVFSDYHKNNQNTITTIEKDSEIGVVADVVDIESFQSDTKKQTYDKFEEIKDYYYFAIETCGEPKYIKYTDVSIIDDSINTSEKFDKTQKIYLYANQYLYSGPGLSFEDNKELITKGSIVEVDTYSRIGTAIWLYVNKSDQKGWILQSHFNSVNYPYNNIKYGSANVLEEKNGELTLENETKLYKYPFSTDELILQIPSGTKISYDYFTSEPQIIYCHINYNGNEGWITVMENGSEGWITVME